MSEPQDINESACGRSDSTEVLATDRDIVKRLRVEGAYMHPTAEICNEAANEIERLRDALAGMTAAADSLHQDVFDLANGG